MADRYSNQSRYPYYRDPDEEYEDDNFLSNRAWNRGDYIQGRPYNVDYQSNRLRRSYRRQYPERYRDQNENLGRDYDALGRQYGQNYANDWGDQGANDEWGGYDWDYGYDFMLGENDYGPDYRYENYPPERPRREYRNYDRSAYRTWNQLDHEADVEQDFGADENYRYNRGYGRGYGRGRNTEAYHDYGEYEPENTGGSFDNRLFGGRSRDMYDREGYNRNRSRPYRSAGMRSDYGDDYGYQENRGFGRDFRSTRFDQEPGYNNYVGYDSEGAFYQDLDNPYSNDYWDAGDQNFSGIGPQDYQRSDQRIMEDVCERLTDHGMIDASDIEINVDNRKVTLNGTVPDRQTKRMAEDIVDDVFGVDDIDNNLKVANRQVFNRRQNWQTNGQSYNWARNRQNQSSQIPDTGSWTPQPTTRGAVQETREQHHKNIHEGMEVIGRNGHVIGTVKEVRDTNFLVDRPMARDVYVPFTSIQSIDERVMLSILSDQINDQEWENPNII